MATSGELKYVRHSAVGSVVWPKSDNLWHLDVAQAVGRQGNSIGLFRVHGHVVSAGFVRIADGKVTCYGRSESLGIGSQLDDSEALAKQLGLSL